MMNDNEFGYFPMFVDISAKETVVIGAGKIATRRITTLTLFTKRITVISKEISKEVEELWKQGKINVKRKAYDREDLYGADLVIAASNDEKLNDEIHSVCKCLGIPVNVSSDRRKCDFHFPGVVKKDHLVIAVNAGGKDHRLAKRTREQIEEMFGEKDMIAPEKIRIGSRESKLAVIQSEMVKKYIESVRPDAEVSLVTMKTTGDIILDRTLDKVGGKGLFVKELDKALMEDRSDLSVHSLKDMPMEVPEELPLIAYSKREDPRDVLVLPKGVEEMDSTKPIGCSSLRRILQLKEMYPNAEFKSVRGNVLTRLRKLDEGEYSALILAAAGLKRLGLEERISRYFAPEEVIPSAGQGILAVQGRKGKDYSYLENYKDADSTVCALAERAFVRYLDGGCSSPVAAHARVKDGKLHLLGLYYSEQLKTYNKGEATGALEDAEEMGIALAKELKEKLERA